jgi:hypothetical protein
MNGISYLYYDAVNQKSSLFRPIVYGLLVLSHCQTRNFVPSFSLRSVAKLSIKSHSHVSIVGICLANAIRLCS